MSAASVLPGYTNVIADKGDTELKADMRPGHRSEALDTLATSNSSSLYHGRNYMQRRRKCSFGRLLLRVVHVLDPFYAFAFVQGF